MNKMPLVKKEMMTYYPKDKKEWRHWLINNHLSLNSIWVVFYKKNSKSPSISWSEAVDEALCFGWIDSTKKTIDKESYIQYFCKRKPNSTWSKINKDKITQLIKNNKITKAGLDSIEIAKQNGSWQILDDVEKLIIPKDLNIEFENNPLAKEFYLKLSKSKKKEILAWIILAKRIDTRKKRIQKTIEFFNTNLYPK